jgi:hypothetical protein
MIRTSPHPLIPVSPSESETRRVPAPSHPAQRDVAKTHVFPGHAPRAPGAEPNSGVTFTWRTCRFGGNLKRIDNLKIVLDSGFFLKCWKLDRIYVNYLFP